jgi:thimet oligopeptidase
MEHWVWRSDVLRRFARHYETNQPIPDELVEQLVAARQLNKGIFQLRQAQFGVLDAEFHAPGADKDLEAILRETHEISLMPLQEGTFFPASFGHLLGGYEASYYGYMWSEVFGDDMFSRFEDEGVTDPKVGMDYRKKVLEVGGSADAEDILRDFLGREPDNSAFLRKLGVAGTDPGSQSSNS